MSSLFRQAEQDPRTFEDPKWMAGLCRGFGSSLLGSAGHDEASLPTRFDAFQSRVDLKAGLPVRFFPFSRDVAKDAPRTVAIDPQIRFGRPTVQGVPTDVLAERWRAGDSVTVLAEDYGLTIADVEDGLRYEAAPSPPALALAEAVG